CLVDSRVAIYDYTIHRNLFTRLYNHDIPNSNIIDMNHYFLPITSNECFFRCDTHKRTNRISCPIHGQSFKLFTDCTEHDNKRTSPHSPIMAPPITATVIRVLMSNSKRNKFCKPTLKSDNPPTTIDAKNNRVVRRFSSPFTK